MTFPRNSPSPRGRPACGQESRTASSFPSTLKRTMGTPPGRRRCWVPEGKSPAGPMPIHLAIDAPSSTMRRMTPEECSRYRELLAALAEPALRAAIAGQSEPEGLAAVGAPAALLLLADDAA